MLNRWGEMGPLDPKDLTYVAFPLVLSIIGKTHLIFPLFKEKSMVLGKNT